MYYVEVFRGWLFPSRVYVSDYYETRAEAEKAAREIEADADWDAETGEIRAYVVEA